MANIKKSQWDSVFDEIREDLRGDFIGFTWDGMSMSRLGIARTSGGNRYNENLLPTMQDKTTQIPGADGTYYFNSFYTQKPFSISFAFDHLTEKGLRQLKQLFGDKGIHRLSFDEQPYKEYMVKVTGQPQLKYIPFDDEAGAKRGKNVQTTAIYSAEELSFAKIQNSSNSTPERIYKGEGTLTLTAFTPYARSRAKTIEDLYKLGSFVKENDEWVLRKKKDDNGNLVYDENGEIVYDYLDEEEDVYMVYKDQWQAASGILDNLDEYDTLQPANKIKLYNPGDTEADFILRLKDELAIKEPLILDLYKIPKFEGTNNTSAGELVFTISQGELVGEDRSIQINSKVELIEGIDKDGKITGNIYNNGIGYGWFFKIPQTDIDNYDYILQITNANTVLTKDNTTIEYSYWYF